MCSPNSSKTLKFKFKIINTRAEAHIALNECKTERAKKLNKIFSHLT